MKRKYILSGLLACALTFSACDVDLLDIPQKGVENEENYYQTDEQCESAIAAVYASWRNAYSGRGEKASQYANGFFLKISWQTISIRVVPAPTRCMRRRYTKVR